MSLHKYVEFWVKCDTCRTSSTGEDYNMKWRSIKDDPPRPDIDPLSSWYLVRDFGGVPQLATLGIKGLVLRDPVSWYCDAMQYDEWLEVPK